MTTALPATQRDLVEALVTERWYMLTMDTEIDSQTGQGEAAASKAWDDLTGQLAYMASRLAGDGAEGSTDTHEVVNSLMETIGEALIAYAVDHRLAEAGETIALPTVEQ